MTELTEAEWREGWKAMLRCVRGGCDHEYDRECVEEVAGPLIDARLAPIRALADEWADPDLITVNGSYRAAEHSHEFADALRAALSADLTAPQPTSGTERQDEGDEAGDGRWTHGDGRSCRRRDDGLWYVGLGIQCLRDHEETR